MWHIGGIPAVRTWYVRLMLSDSGVLIPVALLLAGAFFARSFRDLRHMFLGLGVLLLCAASAASAYIATGVPFTVFAPCFVAVIIVVGTSDLIHLVHRFAEHHANLDGPAEQRSHRAAEAAAMDVGTACLLTSATTALGFLALLATDIPTLRTFGLATGIGVLLTFAITFLVAPPVLARLGAPTQGVSKHAHSGTTQMESLGRWVLDRPKAILGVSALVTLAMIVAVILHELIYW